MEADKMDRDGWWALVVAFLLFIMLGHATHGFKLPPGEEPGVWVEDGM